VSERGSGARWRALLPADPWDRATAAVLLVAAALALLTFRDYGLTWDEPYHLEYGRDVVAWFASGGRDQSAFSGGNRMGDLYLYGAAFDVAAQLASRLLPLDVVETRHLLNALVSLLGLWGAGRLARRLAGSRAGFFATALLLSTPTWWGHGFANAKDIPFAAAYPWLLLALLRASEALDRPMRRATLAAGLAAGAALAARPGGLMVVFPLAVGAFGLRLLPAVADRDGARLAAGLAASARRLAAFAAMGWIGMIAVWPYALRSPLLGPLDAAAAARHFKTSGVVRFAGAWWRTPGLPRDYVPTWFANTLPETWFAIAIVAAIGAAIGLRRRRGWPGVDARWTDGTVVAVAAVGPVLGAMAMEPTLYDGIRHFLFVYPPLAALAGWALSAALDRLPRWGGRTALGAIGALAALALVDAARLHPYEYVYFNRAVAGGLERAGRDFELDYWGATGREAMGWIARNVVPPAGRPITVATTAESFVVSHWIDADPALRGRFVFGSERPPDLLVLLTRFFQHRTTGRVLHRVERMGVPLAYVIDGALEASAIALEAGTAAVSLPTGPGWIGTPRIEKGVEVARYDLRYVPGDALAEAEVRTARDGPIPSLDALRAEVAERLGAGPDAGARVRPLEGPSVRGWVAWEPPGGSRLGGSVAAGIVGERAVVIVAGTGGNPQAAAMGFAEWVRRARLADGADRRPP
jgi:hypothetical protein